MGTRRQSAPGPPVRVLVVLLVITHRKPTIHKSWDQRYRHFPNGVFARTAGPDLFRTDAISFQADPYASLDLRGLGSTDLAASSFYHRLVFLTPSRAVPFLGQYCPSLLAFHLIVIPLQHPSTSRSGSILLPSRHRPTLVYITFSLSPRFFIPHHDHCPYFPSLLPSLGTPTLTA